VICEAHLVALEFAAKPPEGFARMVFLRLIRLIKAL